ncbi:GNAT family N-acetyltransferase [Streptomyces sp. NBC_01456]|uniref:GNAT family N-acetyltransferase n=1 Tax=unclassified Streptomyces TaxID=2593676 RepID=UPI002E2F3DEF|nr:MULTISPECIES: GNAT family N-acetyltransferase [unclassified Streptomyces]
MAANSPSASLTVVPLARYTKKELGEILGEVEDPFGVAYTGLTWLAKERHFGIRRDGRLVAHTGLVTLPVAVGTVETEVVGFGGVAVAPDLRGQGLARLVVTGAREHARTMGPRFGLLFCRPHLVPLYQRLGWQALPGKVHVEQPEGPAVMPLQTMWTPLRDGERWPEGPVRLRSLPM